MAAFCSRGATMFRGQQLLLLLFFRGSLINAGEWASARLYPWRGQVPNALQRTLCMGESSGLLASLTLPKTGNPRRH